MTAKIWTFNPENLYKDDALILDPFTSDPLILDPLISTSVIPDLSTIRVLVGGCFDVLHFGHIKFLQAAKALGNFLCIALESDEKIIQTKGRRPIHTQSQRAEILAHLRSVDEIVLLPFMTGYKDYFVLVQQLKPNYLAVTAGDPQIDNKQKQAVAISAELIIVTDNIPDFSSSHLIREQDWI